MNYNFCNIFCENLIDLTKRNLLQVIALNDYILNRYNTCIYKVPYYEKKDRKRKRYMQEEQSMIQVCYFCYRSNDPLRCDCDRHEDILDDFEDVICMCQVYTCRLDPTYFSCIFDHFKKNRWFSIKNLDFNRFSVKDSIGSMIKACKDLTYIYHVVLLMLRSMRKKKEIDDFHLSFGTKALVTESTPEPEEGEIIDN